MNSPKTSETSFTSEKIIESTPTSRANSEIELIAESVGPIPKSVSQVSFQLRSKSKIKIEQEYDPKSLKSGSELSFGFKPKANETELIDESLKPVPSKSETKVNFESRSKSKTKSEQKSQSRTNSETESIAESLKSGSENFGSEMKPNKSKRNSESKSMEHVPKSGSKIFGLKSKSKKKNKPPPQEVDIDVESDLQLDLEPENELKPKLKDERHNWWNESVTEFAFNLPSVRANLDRLIGKDIVQLNDHKFMMELRKKVWEDFDEKLIEKIQQREDLETERTKKLILKCKYNRYNCPKKLLPLHSAVLALDLDNKHSAIVKAIETRQRSSYDGPIFNINKKTNATVCIRRMKIKSIRKKNFEYLMRQVLKDIQANEKIEYDELKAIQGNIKNIQDEGNKKKAKQSKYLQFITKMVEKCKSILSSKKESKQSDHEKTLLDAISQKSITADTAVRAEHPELFKTETGLKKGSKGSQSSTLNSKNAKSD